MKVKDISSALEEWAPLALQESYDNCGLLVGNDQQEVNGVLITLDVTEEVISEAISEGCNLIIAHHPLIFGGLKRITNKHWVERCVTLAIKNDISIYAIHTNLDNVSTGVNHKIAERLGLKNLQVLSPKSDQLCKLITFVPTTDKENVLSELYEAGAGEIGEYSECSFQTEGTGTFKPSSKANPSIGEAGKREEVHETRIEVIVTAHGQQKVLKALKKAHPYEEVAYYLIPTLNSNQEIGSGMVGELKSSMTPSDFIDHLKKSMDLQVVRHTDFVSDSIQKVAVCGGSGSFLINAAKASGADAFITSDIKYHDFFEADSRIVLADIGHYESEIFTKDLLHDFLTQKFANIAFRLSGVVTNPVKIS